jgi:hypothetical protein
VSQQLDELRMPSQAWRNINRPLVTFGGLDARAILVALPLVFIQRWWLFGVVVVIWVGLVIANQLRLPTSMALRRLRVLMTSRRKLLKPWYCKQ